jgi:hypothetical protein
MAKSKYGLGTFSNGGLGSIIKGPADAVIEAMQLRIKNDENQIGQNYDEIINRVDEYIKKNIGAFSSKSSFAKWFYDKLKINHTGKNLRKVTEEEIFLNAKEYVEYLDKIRRSSKIGPLRLNYGMKNDLVIKILFDNLYPEKIDLHLNEFKNHFSKTNFDSLIRWKGTETEFVNLFTSIKFDDNNLFISLSNHFENRQGKKFLPNQLSVSKSKSTEANYRGKENIENLLKLIKEIRS